VDLYFEKQFTSSQYAGSTTGRRRQQGPPTTRLVVFDLAAKRQLNRGYNDGLSRALEIVLAPLLFGLVGRALDGWLGTEPVLMLTFGAFAVAGTFVKLWVGYDRAMRRHEAELPGGSARAAAATSTSTVTATGDGASGGEVGGGEPA
jgi:putative F0F1-ATPase subunit (Ca2+/Mg2+ transporter)